MKIVGQARGGRASVRPRGLAPRSRLLRIAVLIAVILVGLFFAYLVAANLIIRTRLLRSWINESEDKTWVEYESAYTVWPGHVRVRNLLVRDRDETVEWALIFKHARARIRLIDLLRKRFHAVHLRAKGVQFKLRTRPPASEAASRDTRYLPAIPGFDGPPPPRGGQDSTTPLTGEWRVHLEDVLASVDQIWLDNYRYSGRASLSGGMFLHPKTELEVVSSSLELRGGTVDVKNTVISQPFTGRLQAVIHPCDLSKDPSDRVLVALSGSASAEGSLGDARFLNVLLEPPEYIKLSGGTGRATAALKLDRGHGAGRLQGSTKDVEAIVGNRVLKGGIEGELKVTEIDLDALTADLSETHIDLRDVVVRKGASSTPWWGRLRLLSGMIHTSKVTRVDAHVAMTARDARPLYAMVNAKLPGWAEKVLEMEGVKATAHVAFQKTRLDINDLDAKGESVRIRGQFHRRGDSRSGAFLIEDGPAAIGLLVEDERTRLKTFFARHWYKKSFLDKADGRDKDRDRDKADTRDEADGRP